MRHLLLLILFVQMSCSVAELRAPSQKERSFYEIGLDSLSEGKYTQAEEKFKELLNNFPTTRWLSSSYYHLGYALEMQQKYPEAAEKYNKVVEYYQGAQSKEAAEAQYRLSICLEAMGDDNKVVLALKQIQPSLKYLSKEIAETEWPARMAAAYARLGDQDEAKLYYAKADLGLKKIRSGTFLDTSRWLPKTFYSMGATPEGRLEFDSIENFEKFLLSFGNSQVWLLRAIETKVNPWDDMATKHLLNVYNKSFEFIDKIPPEEGGQDKMLALKKRQEVQKALATKLDSLINNLKAEQKNKKSNLAVFKELKPLEYRVDLLLQQRDVRDKDIRQVPKYRGKIRQ
ncbi:MAG: outer membrane protein assembly factor BamD [Oligoflexia bacterium]|nr:outer membrane protein assembly factor BamD [Oligoflexia bacterium]